MEKTAEGKKKGTVVTLINRRRKRR